MIMEEKPSTHTKEWWLSASPSINIPGWTPNLASFIEGDWSSSFSLSIEEMDLLEKYQEQQEIILGERSRIEKQLKAGKWLIFMDREHIDDVWAKIKTATEQGRLGMAAKVSTAKSKSADIGYKKGIHVICVYTSDWTDEKDVKRVREELRKLGITNKIPYKADEDTIKGKYAAKGHKSISKYYE